MADKPGVYTEWRVTADHSTALWQDAIGPYVFVWSVRTTPHLCCDDAKAEAAARDFVAECLRHGGLVDLRLTRRMVTVTEWAEVEL